MKEKTKKFLKYILTVIVIVSVALLAADGSISGKNTTYILIALGAGYGIAKKTGS